MAKQRRSCDACYKRKILCARTDDSGASSQCNWCHHHDLTCTYDRVRPRRKRQRCGEASVSVDASSQYLVSQVATDPKDETLSASNSAALASESPSRTHRQGRTVTSPYGHESPVSPPSSPHINHLGPGQFFFAGQTLGVVSATDGIPYFTSAGRDLIFSVTGQRPRSQMPRTRRLDEPPSAGRGRPLTPLSAFDDCADGTGKRLDDTKLPMRWVVESLLSTFSDSDFSFVFPIVDSVLFVQTLDVAYKPWNLPPTQEQLCARACVFAFVSIAASHFPHAEGASLLDVEGCAREASMSVEHASVAGLQLTLTLMMYRIILGSFEAASMLHATACRLIFILGGHTSNPVVPQDRPLTLQEREAFHLRALFWLSYVLDKDIAIRTGQPPMINDDFCDLTLPEGYVENRFARPLQHREAESQGSPSLAGLGHSEVRIPCLPGDLRLNMLKSKASRLMYMAQSGRKSEAELLRTIRELDEDLEKWRVSIPPKFSPSLSIPRHTSGLDVGLPKEANMLHIDLHLQYHHLLCVIHCASGGCVNDSKRQAGSEQLFGVQSSLDISVEASRSTLLYLEKAVHTLASEAFWIFTFYPVSALMTLFFNILRNPLAAQAVHDVELLRSASDLIKNIPMWRVTPTEVAYLRKVDDFIADLSRLGRCAIEKARAEQEQH